MLMLEPNRAIKSFGLFVECSLSSEESSKLGSTGWRPMKAVDGHLTSAMPPYEIWPGPRIFEAKLVCRSV